MSTTKFRLTYTERILCTPPQRKGGAHVMPLDPAARALVVYQPPGPPLLVEPPQPPAVAERDLVPVYTSPLPRDRNPAAVYLAGKPSAAGRRGLQNALRRATRVLTGRALLRSVRRGLAGCALPARRRSCAPP